MQRMRKSELSSLSKNSVEKEKISKLSSSERDDLLAKLQESLSHASRGSMRRSGLVDPKIAKMLEDEVESYDFKSLKEHIDYHKKAIEKINFAPAIISGGRRVEEAVHGLNLVGCIDSAVHLCGHNFISIFHKDLDIDQFAATYVRHLSEETQELKSVKSAIASELKQPTMEEVHIDLVVEHNERLRALEDQQFAEYQNRVSMEARTRSEMHRKLMRDMHAAGLGDHEDDEYDEDDNATTLPINFRANFNSSPEKKKLKKLMIAEEEIFQRACQNEFAERCKEYKRQKRDSQVRKEREHELSHRQDKSKLVQQLANGYRDHLIAIAIQVRNAVQNYPEIIQKLRLQVIIEASGRVVNDPFSPQSPCIRAMYQTLCNEYRKANLVTTCQMLMTMFSRKPPSGGVTAAVSQINEDLIIWDQMNLMQYMNKDKLFTIALLRTLPSDSEVRGEGVRRVIEYARQMENFGDYLHSDEEMPLYRHLSSWINDVYMRSKPLISSSNTAGGGDKTQRTKDSRSQYESAAAATTFQGKTGGAEPPTAPSASTQARRIVKEDTLFPSEVTRDRNWFVSVPNKNNQINEHPYTVTREDCAACLGIKPGGAHKPRCFLYNPCHKCKLYGHKAIVCHQRAPSSASSSATANSAAEGVERKEC